MLIIKIFNNIHRKIVKTRLYYKERLLDGEIQQEFFWSHLSPWKKQMQMKLKQNKNPAICDSLQKD